MKARDLRRRPVLDVDEAREIGRVVAVVVDPEQRRVVALRVDGASPVLPLDGVRSFGPDAVTVEGADTLRMPTTDLEQRAVDAQLDPLGMTVLGDDGNQMGRVEDLEIDDDGALRTLHLTRDDVAADRLLGVGGYAVVVRA